MTTEQVFKKAMEGGWKPKVNYWSNGEQTYPIENAVLERGFWQALGKAMGWGVSDGFDLEAMSRGGSPVSVPNEKDWLYHATHYFKDYAMKGKSAEEFFKEL